MFGFWINIFIFICICICICIFGFGFGFVLVLNFKTALKLAQKVAKTGPKVAKRPQNRFKNWSKSGPQLAQRPT
jgi:predicted PurR-regulated permease PerM